MPIIHETKNANHSRSAIENPWDSLFLPIFQRGNIKIKRAARLFLMVASFVAVSSLALPASAEILSSKPEILTFTCYEFEEPRTGHTYGFPLDVKTTATNIPRPKNRQSCKQYVAEFEKSRKFFILSTNRLKYSPCDVDVSRYPPSMRPGAVGECIFFMIELSNQIPID